MSITPPISPCRTDERGQLRYGVMIYQQGKCNTKASKRALSPVTPQPPKRKQMAPIWASRLHQDINLFAARLYPRSGTARWYRISPAGIPHTTHLNTSSFHRLFSPNRTIAISLGPQASPVAYAQRRQLVSLYNNKNRAHA